MKEHYQIENDHRPHHIVMRTTSGVNAFLESRHKDLLVSEMEISQKEKGLLIHAWVILSNQIHIIGAARKGYSLAKIIGDFRRRISIKMLKHFQSEKDNQQYRRYLMFFEQAARINRRLTTYQFWQVDKKPAELISRENIEQLIKGFHETPVIERLADKPEDYPYSSAGTSRKIKTDPIDYTDLEGQK